MKSPRRAFLSALAALPLLPRRASAAAAQPAPPPAASPANAGVRGLARRRARPVRACPRRSRRGAQGHRAGSWARPTSCAPVPSSTPTSRCSSSRRGRAAPSGAAGAGGPSAERRRPLRLRARAGEPAPRAEDRRRGADRGLPAAALETLGPGARGRGHGHARPRPLPGPPRPAGDPGRALALAPARHPLRGQGPPGHQGHSHHLGGRALAEPGLRLRRDRDREAPRARAPSSWASSR